jgi:hypothetical protein
MTLTPRERVIRALTFRHPDRAPRELWALPGVVRNRQDELATFYARFPSDFAGPDVTYGRAARARGTEAEVGEYVDAWGCPFTVLEPGVIGEVKAAPLADWAALDGFRPPDEILRDADFSRVDASCAATDRFVKAGTTIRPFERMQFLRGTEALFMDLAWGPAELYRLRDMVHDFFLRELEMWTRTGVDAISFMDDWGTQKALLISPKLWREFYKPLYKDYCDRIHAAGKYVFFHSDGYIFDIYPDLIEVGVDAVNSQLFCMDIEEIARRHKGRVTFWGEISRQDTLPLGTPEDCYAAVRRVRAALDDGSGGLIAECEWGNDVPAENVHAVYEAWEEPRAGS